MDRFAFGVTDDRMVRPLVAIGTHGRGYSSRLIRHWNVALIRERSIASFSEIRESAARCYGRADGVPTFRSVQVMSEDTRRHPNTA
jgi:hypothetical protein